MLLARRDTREKLPTPMDGLAPAVVALLDEIQATLLARALKFREEHTQRVATYDEFKAAMEGRPGFVIAGWCGERGLRGGDQGRNAGDAAEHPVQRRRRRLRGDLREVRKAVFVRRSLVREGVLVQACATRSRAASGHRDSIRFITAWRRVTFSRRPIAWNASPSWWRHRASPVPVFA